MMMMTMSCSSTGSSGSTCCRVGQRVKCVCNVCNVAMCVVEDG